MRSNLLQDQVRGKLCSLCKGLEMVGKSVRSEACDVAVIGPTLAQLAGREEKELTGCRGR